VQVNLPKQRLTLAGDGSSHLRTYLAIILTSNILEFSGYRLGYTQMKNVFFAIVLACVVVLPANAQNDALITASTITTDEGREEFAIIIRPEANEPGKTFPVLYAPGDRNYPDPSFFWGDSPTKLGWIIVQTEAVYNGTPEQLRSVMESVEATLRREGYQTAERHLVSWSGNSGAGARQAGALGASLRSASFIPGYGTGRSVGQICAHKNLHINFITGSRDRSWLRGAKTMRNKLEACGMKHVAFAVIENGGHILKEIAGEPFFKVLNDTRSDK